MDNDLRLDDGFATIITLENLPDVKIFEREVTPPGYSGGGPIDTTTMRNLAYRTMAPKKLKTLSKVSVTAAYATSALDGIWAQIGVVQLITITFPDGSTLAFYGWIDEFTPAAHKEGDQPTASITIQPAMRNPTTGAEVAPVYTAPSEESSG